MGSVVKSVTGAVSGAVNGVGKMLGIGGGNTAEFNPGQYTYNPNKDAFKATGMEQAADMAGIQRDSAGRMVNEQDVRNKQSSLASALEAAMNGIGDSIAGRQLKQATDRNLQQQMALAASTRGGANPALVQRELMKNQAATNQAAAGQAGDLRLQEQQQARAQLGDVLAQSRAQDQATNAQQQATQLQAIQGQQSVYDANRNAQIQLEAMRSGNTSAVANAAAADAASRRDNNTKGLGALASGVGQALGGAAIFSDERAKKDIKDGSKDANSFLDALEAHIFKYKDPSNGKGERIGVMAQDVEKGGSLGEKIVKDTAQGKQIDLAQGYGAILASLAELNRRTKKLQ